MFFSQNVYKEQKISNAKVLVFLRKVLGKNTIGLFFLKVLTTSNSLWNLGELQVLIKSENQAMKLQWKPHS